MPFDATKTLLHYSHPTVYLDVVRMDDGRYRVRFVKDDMPPRISYTRQADAVAQQARHAGNIAVRTSDADVQHSCTEQQITLIAAPSEHRAE